MRNLWFALVTGALLCFGGTLTASAAGNVTLLDSADALTDEEYDICKAGLLQAAGYTGMDFGVTIGSPDLPEGAAEETARIQFEQEFGDTDGVYVFLDAREENPQHAIYVNGLAKLYYTDTADCRLNEFFTDMESFLSPSADMAGAIGMLTVNLEYFYSVGMAEDVYVYLPETGLYYYSEDDKLLNTDAPPEDAVISSGDAAVSIEVQTEPEQEQEQDMSALQGTGNAVLYDEAGRLSSAEYDACLAYLQDAADATGMNVAMVLGKERRSEYTIESLADASYDELFGPNTDGLLYYMDLSGASEPYDYISTCGMGQMYYTNADDNNRIDAIFDDVFPFLYPAGSEDIEGAVEEFAEQVVYYYEAGVPNRYYVYDDVYDEYYYVEDGKLQTSYSKPYISIEAVVTMAFGGLIIGFIAALITFFAVKAHYKFKSALSPTTYVNRKNLVFHQQYDRFIREYTTRVKIESSSGGGSRGGGGGHSSGGHGGGGRHR
ncbi:MAG: TPM domain-containing protein [Oscillospiraceae bacterium]|nr:TPM domain-containing protein [Oscillospiraceae bacterium]